MRLPEYSLSSIASTTPEALVRPFHLVQNTLECLSGHSSAIKTPAFVSSPLLFTILNDS